MPQRNHLRLNTNAQRESKDTFNFNYGFKQEESQEDEKDYTYMANTFQEALDFLEFERFERDNERDEELTVPHNIEYIRILFFDQFNNKFFNSYYSDFGLQAFEYNQFNREILFAISEEEKFESFLNNIESFISNSLKDTDDKFNANILFIKEFELLTTEGIVGQATASDILNFKLPVFPVADGREEIILDALIEYLNERDKDWKISDDKSIVEIHNLDSSEILEIAENFDIVTSITNTLGTIIQPSELGIEERLYGFTIPNANENLPIIGVIDTGIGVHTPLEPLLLDDERFTITGTSPFVDNACNGLGHGTGVAAFAALGKRAHHQNFQGEIEADAKLLSMKILDQGSADISGIEVLKLLRDAKAAYPEIRIFVLTVCFQLNKLINSIPSNYAYQLDKFSVQNDCLIIISAANNPHAENQTGYSLDYLNSQESILCSPAESMNNLTVGASADNLKIGDFDRISPGPEYPAIYSRTSHIKLEEFKDPKKERYTKNNHNLFKPDLIESGGDYEKGNGFIGTGEKASLEVLSADPTRSFVKQCGTSFSAPLVANMAAQLLRKHPDLRAQTIKALLINSASKDRINVSAQHSKTIHRSIGHGIIDSEKCLNSSDDRMTFIIEDSINPENMEIIPLHFPEYLSKTDLGKSQGILTITATLCFDFLPDQSNHLSYCPYHLAFSIFRNHTHDEILTKEELIKSKLRHSWSQNNRWKEKPIPPSNVQKMSFQIGKTELLDEDSTFKLAIHATLSTQLLNHALYDHDIPYSMAVSIEENLKENTGKLYDELEAINELDALLESHATAEVALS